MAGERPKRDPLLYQASRLQKPDMLSFARQSPHHEQVLRAEIDRRVNKLRAGYDELLRDLDATREGK